MMPSALRSSAGMKILRDRLPEEPSESSGSSSMAFSGRSGWRGRRRCRRRGRSRRGTGSFWAPRTHTGRSVGFRPVEGARARVPLFLCRRPADSSLLPASFARFIRSFFRAGQPSFLNDAPAPVKHSTQPSAVPLWPALCSSSAEFTLRPVARSTPGAPGPLFSPADDAHGLPFPSEATDHRLPLASSWRHLVT
jgi:hypothetical protein